MNQLQAQELQYKHQVFNYEVHCRYLQPLLDKHEKQQGIQYEDLIQSWNNVDRWTSSCSANANTNNSVSDGSGNGSASECEWTKRGVDFAFVVKDDPICLEIISKVSQCDSVMELLQRSAVFHSQFTASQ